MSVRPKPVVDHDTKPFWDAVAQHRLLLRHCEDCGRYIFYPRAVCPHCFSDRLTWREASGRGTIYTYTVSHRAVAPYWEGKTPYVVALIDLEEGPRMLSNVLAPPEAVHVGQKVRVVFTTVDDWTYPEFVPAE
ncbi:MAG: Zn-ribbon domain-containing OB-fold protein [Actinomycetia bacterium]|nr:Zn-ribbon domain-containing OB-fold protein [Actinomycetes bacterium]